MVSDEPAVSGWVTQSLDQSESRGIARGGVSGYQMAWESRVVAWKRSGHLRGMVGIKSVAMTIKRTPGRRCITRV